MANGEDLVAAITSNVALKKIANCAGVPAQLSTAVYGSAQTDLGHGTKLKKDMKEAYYAISTGGMSGQTAVWHFATDPVHHFAVVPWYQNEHPTGQQKYSVFMAYEWKYTFKSYVKGGGIAPNAGGKGYKPSWTAEEVATMLYELLDSTAAWEEYFGNVGQDQATEIRYWRYGGIPIDQAIANVNRFNG